MRQVKDKQSLSLLNAEHSSYITQLIIVNK